MILVLNLSKIVNSDTLEKLIWLWNQRSFQDCFHSPSLKYPCLWTTKTICIYMWSTLQLWSFLTLVRAFKHDFCMFFSSGKTQCYIFWPLSFCSSLHLRHKVRKEVMSIFRKGWLAIAKLKALSLFISVLSMVKKAFYNVKIEKWKVKVVSALQ